MPWQQPEDSSTQMQEGRHSPTLELMRWNLHFTMGLMGAHLLLEALSHKRDNSEKPQLLALAYGRGCTEGIEVGRPWKAFSLSWKAPAQVTARHHRVLLSQALVSQGPQLVVRAESHSLLQSISLRLWSGDAD